MCVCVGGWVGVTVRQWGGGGGEREAHSLHIISFILPACRSSVIFGWAPHSFLFTELVTCFYETWNNKKKIKEKENAVFLSNITRNASKLMQNCH